jgi:Zn-dependent peptidase ImmA (M78 family)/DNA-binding XRE family transcriptional regulator
MAKSLIVEINPEIIKWARETAGYSKEETAKKLKLSEKDYEKLEKGEQAPTFRQLKLLANLFKRPLSVFFLPSPPEEPPILSSFRILPKKETEISKELRLAIRKARYYQSIANELMTDLGIDPTPKIEKTKIEDNPLVIAKRERNKSSISIDEQYKFKNAYYAFNVWRNFVESKNILVFQFKFPLKDSRGFCLMDKTPYVIAINSEDNILARIFTLFHEYAHILLGISELYSEEINTNQEVERWCDIFASEFLIPQEELKKDKNFPQLLKTEEPNLELIEELSKKFKVSKQAVVTKLKFLDLITSEEYKKYKEALETREISEEKPVIIPPERKILQEKGSKFISIVLDSKENGLITTQEFFELSSIKPERLNKLEELVFQEV